MQNVRRKDIDSIPSWTYFLSEISSKREANEEFMARWIVDNSEIFNDCACCMLLFGFQLSARKYVQEPSWVSNVMNRMLGTTLHHNTLLCVACWRTKVTKQKTAANRYQVYPENVFKRCTGSTNWATQFRFKVSTCQRCSSRHYSPPWSWCTVRTKARRLAQADPINQSDMLVIGSKNTSKFRNSPETAKWEGAPPSAGGFSAPHTRSRCLWGCFRWSCSKVDRCLASRWRQPNSVMGHPHNHGPHKLEIATWLISGMLTLISGNSIFI